MRNFHNQIFKKSLFELSKEKSNKFFSRVFFSPVTNNIICFVIKLVEKRQKKYYLFEFLVTGLIRRMSDECGSGSGCGWISCLFTLIVHSLLSFWIHRFDSRHWQLFFYPNFQPRLILLESLSGSIPVTVNCFLS